MINAAKVIELISNTAGYNDKQFILKKSENVEGLKEILRFIYNPYHKTGISSAKYLRVLEIADALSTDKFVDYKAMLAYFKTHQTGTETDLVMAAHFINSTRTQYPDYPYAIEVARAIITQDFQIGVTSTTLNTVYGKTFIPKIDCMLGKKFGDVGPAKTKWPCIVTEKLDGIRRVLVKENGVCRFYSRSGHEDTGLIEILEEAKYLPDNRVYDGELLAAGDYTDSIALRQATNSIGNSGGNKTGLIFNVFDMLDSQDYWDGKSSENAATRKIMLGATLMDESIQLLDDNWPMLIASYGIHQELKFIKPVPILGVVKSIDEVDQIVEPIWARGGEGVMLNSISGFYEKKRSKELLKVKKTQEFVLVVTDVVEGTGKFEGMLGALVVDYDGVRLGVGSGFTEPQRRHIWDNPEMYVGKKIEIDSFGESTNMLGTKSLNCPIFKRFVGDEE
jgi:DNA ligase 1